MLYSQANINKLANSTKVFYLTKQYIRSYSSKKASSYQVFRELDTFKDTVKHGLTREVDMQNKIIFGSVGLLFGAMGWSIAHTDARFEQVDKRFEHLEKEVSEIKSILQEMNSRKGI